MTQGSTTIAEIRTFHPDFYFDFLKWAIPSIGGVSEDDFKELLNARSAASCDSDLILINKDLENVIAQQCATSDKNSRSRSDSPDSTLCWLFDKAVVHIPALAHRHQMQEVSFRDDALSLYAEVIGELHARSDESADLEGFWVFRLGGPLAVTGTGDQFRGTDAFSYPQLTAFECDQGLIDDFRLPSDPSIDASRWLSVLLPERPPHCPRHNILVGTVLKLMGGLHGQFIDSRRQSAARELLHNAVNGLAPAICESNPEALQGYNNQFEQAESKIVRARAVFNQVLRT